MTALHDREPIFAVATGDRAAAIAIIRISGEKVLPMLAAITSKRDKEWQARHFYLLKLQDHDDHLDTCLAVFFPAPHSYTGQDMVEIHCHGGTYIRQRICELLQSINIRPAAAGEFTKRAFLNGKLDLVNAEGISQLITADTESQWRAAKSLVSGSLQKQINALRHELIKALSLLNAAIDFPDERETQTLQVEAVETAVVTALAQIKRMLASYQHGRIAAKGLRLALVGKPNVGKSSLLNLLLAKQRAIVSPVAGTTRDYLEEDFLLAGRLFKIIDTAGLHATDNRIEQYGVAKAKELAQSCDLVCIVAAVDDDTFELPALELETSRVLKVINKIDLAPEVNLPTNYPSSEIAISCKTGAGIPLLYQQLIEKFDYHTHALKDKDSIISCERHYLALRNSAKSLELALEELRQHNHAECIAFELQHTVQELADIVGNVSNEDVLAEIFSKFCLGK